MKKWNSRSFARVLCALLALLMIVGVVFSAVHVNAAEVGGNAKTGDNSPVVYFLVLMGLSLVAIVILVIYLIRKNKK